jgi:hypothetical protein
MIQQIKTALMGDGPRTNGGTTTASRDATPTNTRDAPDVNEIDPFRPAADLAADANQDRVAMDHVFGILGNERRRYVLKYLSMTEGTATLNDLAERIAAWQCDKKIAQITSQERKRVYVSLYQCHLPKMDDVSAVSYDKERGTIETGEQFERFTYYLRRDE